MGMHNGSGVPGWRPAATLAFAALLGACGGDHRAPAAEAEAPPVVEPSRLPAVPAGLNVAYGLKSFTLHWNPVGTAADGSAIRYRVLEDPDGPGPLAGVPLATGLAATELTHALDGPLYSWLTASYSVQACNDLGCSPAALPLNINVNQAIGYLKASNPRSSTQFGERVALSEDGNTLAVGAIREASAATGIDGNQSDMSANSAGAVYVFARHDGVWRQQAYVKASNTDFGDGFGRSVALSSDGQTLAVGAFNESSAATGVGGNQADNSASDAGAVYVFVRSGAAWNQQAYVKASNTEANDQFGTRVSLSGDGDTLAVSAVGEDSNALGIDGAEGDNSVAWAGAVYTFVRSAGSWSRQSYIKASNTGASDQFGSALSLSRDGGTLAVGALGEASSSPGVGADGNDNGALGSGAAYVFVRSGPSWLQQAYVKAAVVDAGDSFGSSLALSADGDVLAVGAPAEAGSAAGVDGDATDNSLNAAGAVSVFARSGATWTAQAYLKASPPRQTASLGTDVALSSDGNTLVAGAHQDSGSAIGVGADPALHGAAGAGAAYVFTRSAGRWDSTAYLKAANTAVADWFGVSVGLSGDGKTLAVGAAAEDSGASGINGDLGNNGAINAGAVYLY